MKKFTKLSLIASTAILGTALLTGCGSNSGTSSASTDGSAEIQGSVVNKVVAGGMTLTFDDNTTCTNDSNVSTTGTTLTLNATAFSTCEKALNTYESISVDTTKSYAVENAGDTNAELFSNKVGTAPFKGVAGKKVNILSTVAVATGQPVEDIDVNDNPAIKALKDLLQSAIALGGDLKTISTDLNISTLADFSKTDSTELNSTLVPASVTSAISNATGITINLDEINNLAAVYDDNPSATLADNNSTISEDLNSELEKAANTPLLSLGSTLSVGDQNITVGNGTFSHAITTTGDDKNLTTSDFFDIKFPTVSLLNSGLASPVTVGLSVNIKNDDNQSVTLAVSGAQLNSTENNKSVTVTLPQGTTITASQTGLSTLKSVIGNSSSATTSSDLNNSDFSFNVQTLISELDNTNIENAISELDKFLLAQGSYDVNITLTDLNTSVLKTAYTSVIGTVLVNMSDADIVESAKADLNVSSATSTDLTLPTTLNGATISWATSNASVLSAAGEVTEVSEDTNVTLTATITKGTESDTKEFTVTVQNDPLAGMTKLLETPTIDPIIVEGTTIALSNSSSNIGAIYVNSTEYTSVGTTPAKGLGFKKGSSTASLIDTTSDYADYDITIDVNIGYANAGATFKVIWDDNSVSSITLQAGDLD
jgi:hypothetical protein